MVRVTFFSFHVDGTRHSTEWLGGCRFCRTGKRTNGFGERLNVDFIFYKSAIILNIFQVGM